MVSKVFKSRKSNDCVALVYSKEKRDTGSARLLVHAYDKYQIHMLLINELIKYAEENKIEWICMKMNGQDYFPVQNAALFKNDKTKEISCFRDEHFKPFYVCNMDNVIEQKKIHATKKKRKDKQGFTTIIKPSQIKQEKYNFLVKKVLKNKSIQREKEKEMMEDDSEEEDWGEMMS